MQQLQLWRLLASLFVLSGTSAVSVSTHTQATDAPCEPSDVLWLWSGALTSRSITFKFGLREGYTCADADFVLYAFPELLENERPHSAIAMCSGVDGGEAGEGEERSPSSYETPHVQQCNLSALPHRDREYRYELTLVQSGTVARSGRFRTPKREGAAYNYRVAFASCADEQSDPRVFEAIKNEKALLFMHTGDLHYHNLVVNDVAAFRDGYDSIFASPAGEAMLAMDLPFAYMWDDHDFGPDNSDSTAPGRNASVQAYREFVPHYPLVGGRSRTSTVHQAFTIGRVRYILTDLRSARTPNKAPAAPTKTVLGKKQKAWFKSELVRATSDPDVRLIVWVNTMPWLDDERKWGQFVHEQQELVNYIKAHGLNKWVPIVIVSGDAHMLAVDDGRHSPGNLTVLHAAALGRPGSIKGGPYSHGAFAGSGQYAVMDITDEGGKHGRVCIYYRGMNIVKGMLIEYNTCHPERTPSVAPYYPPPIPVRIAMRIWKKAKRYGGIAALAGALVVGFLVWRSRRQRTLRTRKYS
uniref:PhoD-like phosphatase metallophosphatase domain-containing protein n=1 Tax=Peronospora matthiolae TaxID=2874970 RepID=A0AAV1URG1_9STRA